MSTRAVRNGDDWILNGRKIWITRAVEAAFTIVMAMTDAQKRARGGMSAFWSIATRRASTSARRSQ